MSETTSEESRPLNAAEIQEAISEYPPFGIKHVLAILFAIGMTALAIVFREQVAALQKFAYLGVFLIMLLTSLTIVLPVPGLALVIAVSASGQLNPLLVGLAAGVGAVLGELSGYLAGYGGSAMADNIKAYRRFEGWMRRYGAVTLLVLAFIPNPAFDMAGIVAGVLRMPVWRFLLWAGVGKTLRMIVVAYAAHYSAGWLLRLFGTGIWR